MVGRVHWTSFGTAGIANVRGTAPGPRAGVQTEHAAADRICRHQVAQQLMSVRLQRATLARCYSPRICSGAVDYECRRG